MDIPKTHTCFEINFDIKTTPKGNKFTATLFCKDCGRGIPWAGSDGTGAVSELQAAQAAMHGAHDHCERYHAARVRDIRRRPLKGGYGR
jgi:hypothetical protein